ncbi:helix-turn-helix transcriptional regulator [Streptomyces sp. 7R007]|uniref:helix-turn-helix transcriptional regulator n=1 Tax=Streptomyces sp. NPDC046909 TaxID=3155617 RepID=UPI0033D94353
MTAQFLTRAQTAELVGVSVRTLERWARAGIGPTPRKHGPRLVRYDRDEALAYLQIGERRESA